MSGPATGCAEANEAPLKRQAVAQVHATQTKKAQGKCRSGMAWDFDGRSAIPCAPGICAIIMASPLHTRAFCSLAAHTSLRRSPLLFFPHSIQLRARLSSSRSHTPLRVRSTHTYTRYFVNELRWWHDLKKTWIASFPAITPNIICIPRT